MTAEPGATGEERKRAIYDYTVNIAALEEENHLLRQSVEQLRVELDRYRTPPLMVAEEIGRAHV